MGSFEWYQYFLPKNQSCKLQKLESRLVRPWILFPYKSLKSQIALTLKPLLLWFSNCRKLLILGCSFMWCKLFISFMFVYDKNKDIPLWIGSMRMRLTKKKRINMYPSQQQIPTQLTYRSPEWVHQLFVFFLRGTTLSWLSGELLLSIGLTIH